MNRIFFLLSALVATSCLASARTFTNTAGKTIEAEVISATATKVSLRLDSGKKATVALDTLSEADQEYVKEWAASKVPRLRFDPKMGRSNKDKAYKSSSTGRTYRSSYQQVQTYEMTVDVRNEDNGTSLAESSMKFILVGRSLTSQGQYKVLSIQDLEFSVDAGGKTMIPFRKVENRYYDYDGSTYSRRSRSGYKVIGYVLYGERKKDKREVYSHSSTPLLKQALHNIVLLKEGTVTDNTFTVPERPVRVGDPFGPRREQPADPGPIIVQ